MGPIIKLLMLSLFAFITGAASVARQMVNYGQVVGYGNFSDYCTYPMYIVNASTSEATFDADCSSKVGGANNAGAQLANSQLNFNDCFTNLDGKLMPSKGGNAMQTCTCKMGYSVCGDQCADTAIQCQCKDLVGNMVTGDIFDIGDDIGVTWSEEHQNNLLVCTSPTGDTVAKYQGCTKNGVTRPDPVCPS